MVCDPCRCETGAALEPYRDGGAAQAYAQALEKRNAELEAALQERGAHAIEVTQYRLGIHAASSAVVYTAFAGMMDGALLSHPHLAAFVVACNALAWVITSAVVKFG